METRKILKNFFQTLWVRKIIFFLLTTSTYIAGIISLFWYFQIFQSIVWFLIFFIVFHLFFIDIYKYKEKYFLIIISSLALIEVIIFWNLNYEIMLSIIVLNAGIYFLVARLKTQTHYTTKFDAIGYFSWGSYIFTVGITIAYGLMLLWLYKQFPFNCIELSQASNSVIDFVAKPFKLWREKVDELKNTTKNIFSSSIQDVSKLSKTIEIQSTSTESLLFTDKLKSIKNDIINQAVADNKEINMWVCDYIITKVNEKFNNPKLQIWALIWIFLVTYGFIRIVFRLMIIISRTLFQALYVFWIYKKEKIMVESEMIW